MLAVMLQCGKPQLRIRRVARNTLREGNGLER